MVPLSCFVDGSYPKVTFTVKKGETVIGTLSYVEEAAQPIVVLQANYAAKDVFKIEVTYDWKSTGNVKPAPDYTVKVYSD